MSMVEEMRAYVSVIMEECEVLLDQPDTLTDAQEDFLRLLHGNIQQVHDMFIAAVDEAWSPDEVNEGLAQPFSSMIAYSQSMQAGILGDLSVEQYDRVSRIVQTAEQLYVLMQVAFQA